MNDFIKDEATWCCFRSFCFLFQAPTKTGRRALHNPHQGVQEVSKLTRPDLDCNRGNIAYLMYLFPPFLHLSLYIMTLPHTPYKAKTSKTSRREGDTVRKTGLFKAVDSRGLKPLRLVYQEEKIKPSTGGEIQAR